MTREVLHVDDQWQEVPCAADPLGSDSWVVFSPRHPQEASLREGDDA
jgi:hypothetical protein